MIFDALVLARGGSKGIPGKNIAEVAGKPLIAWTIEMAVASVSVRDVIVSTDSAQIAEVAIRYGARVPGLRPSEISGDFSASEEAIRHAIQTFCREPRPDAFLFPQVTSPVRTHGLFDKAIAKFERCQYDSLFSSARIKNFIWRGGEKPQPMYDTMKRPMRQELSAREIFYRETGNFYIARTEGFLKSGCRTFGKIGMFETNEEEAIEIDEPEDLAIAATALRKC